MLRPGTTADEFDCVDCEQHIYMVPPGASLLTGGRCATCFSMPGWFLVPELRRLWEIDPDWQPPVRSSQTDEPGKFWCEVPGCGCTELLLRINGYDEPFRGRCDDHLHPSLWGRLHAQRNERR